MSRSIAEISAELRANGTVIQRLDPLEKAKANPTSKSLAIRAKCWQCCGAGADGIKETKRTIAACEVLVCPLWNVRPYKGAA